MVKDMEKYTNFDKLSSLEIKDCNLGNFTGFSKLENLQTLSINDGHLSNLKGLENFPNLSYMHICDAFLESFEGLENCPRLKSLEVSEFIFEGMKRLKDCPQVSRLAINSQNLGSLKGIANFTALQDLRIVSFNMPKTVGELERIPSLKNLFINSSIENVEEIKNLSGLQELTIISNNQAYARAYCDWVKELCCNDLASEAKHWFGSDSDTADSMFSNEEHAEKDLSAWDFNTKNDLWSFLINNKNCKTYEGTIDNLTDELCENNTIISLKRPS